MGNKETLRKNILDLVGEYAQKVFEQKDEFIPGETYVPVSGKMIGKNEIQYVVNAGLDGWFTAGRFAAQFENEFAKYMNQRYCLLTNSGSSANLLALAALTSPELKDRKLKQGDEVITVASGFPTTVNPIIQNGLLPVFLDVNLEDYSIDVEQLEAAWSPKVKAVMLAHTLGNPFNLEKVTQFVKKHNLWLIEDCCDAVGTTYNEQMVGTFGDLATVSFYPAHHITMGEGGAVLTNSSKLQKIVKSFRDWGRDCWCEPGNDNTCGKRFKWQLGELPYGYDHKYIYSHLGYNLKVTDMQAAIGLGQLEKLQDFINIRRDNHNYFMDKLNKYSNILFLPKTYENANPSWFGFLITLKDNAPFTRNQFVEFLEKNQVATRLLFGGNILKQPAYLNSNYKIISDLNNTNYIMNNSFWHGVYPGINHSMRAYVIDVIDEFMSLYSA